MDPRSPRRIPSPLVPLGACAYALVAASTTPFTEPANILTAIPVLAILMLLVWRWPLRPQAVRPIRPVASGHPYRLWVLALVVFVAWELYNYVAPGSRANHPTFSSMTDAVDWYYVLKALLFLIWLTLGWQILQSGSGRRHPGTP